MIDLDSSSKLGALVGLFFTFRFALVNLRLSHQKKFKEDYNHAKDFFGEDATPAQQAYIKELGYHAVAGSNQIEGDVIQYLIDLDPKGQILQWYPDSKDYLSTERAGGALRLAYAAKIQKGSKLTLRKVWYSTLITISFLGFGLAMFAFLLGKDNTDTLPTLLLGGLGWGLGLYLAVQELSHLIHAEKIITLQGVTPVSAQAQIGLEHSDDNLESRKAHCIVDPGTDQLASPSISQ